MFEAVDLVGQKTYQDMASFYGLPGPADAKSMLNDVHLANFPENKMFFDPKNSIGSAKIFNLSQEYYKELGALPQNADYDPSSVEASAPLDERRKERQIRRAEEHGPQFLQYQRRIELRQPGAQTVVLTDNVALYFDPNKNSFDIASHRPEFVENMQRLERWRADQVPLHDRDRAHRQRRSIDEADLQGQDFGLRGGGGEPKQLSEDRAAFIKQLLVTHYGLPANRVISKGVGWTIPSIRGLREGSPGRRRLRVDEIEPGARPVRVADGTGRSSAREARPEERPRVDRRREHARVPEEADILDQGGEGVGPELRREVARRGELAGFLDRDARSSPRDSASLGWASIQASASLCADT